MPRIYSPAGPFCKHTPDSNCHTAHGVYCSAGELVCCAKPLTSTTICLAPTFPFKRTCCPPSYVCMADGGCCPKAQYCYDPVSKKESCCKENQPCINGKCCDRTLNDVCRPWPSLQGQECCPKGNCLVAWNANPYPGIPTPPPVINTCCPPVSC